jgi:hypothetical protein
MTLQLDSRSRSDLSRLLSDLIEIVQLFSLSFNNFAERRCVMGQVLLDRELMELGSVPSRQIYSDFQSSKRVLRAVVGDKNLSEHSASYHSLF